ncbi:Protein tyrosine phosphatase type IVA 1 [Lobulomyces angularis]|nr:Protein tyrosine phosphatase type IVA 1 [Lobulomyces angularis]
MNCKAHLHDPSLIKHEICPITFLITDCPTDESINSYLNILKENNVKLLIRLCEPTHYDSKFLIDNGIQVIDEFAFQDGTVPSNEKIEKYRQLTDSIIEKESNPVIAIHCVSGIGRAPLFAAIPLIDYGEKPLDTIEFIRKKRRGAFNKTQVNWLLNDEKKGFKRRKVKKSFFAGLFGKNKN